MSARIVKTVKPQAKRGESCAVCGKRPEQSHWAYCGRCCRQENGYGGGVCDGMSIEDAIDFQWAFLSDVGDR